ncbi:hypothetical protein GGS23DRAFT_262546 [Durotheca rogersii]|uniref:uncharacterized protein n=1 Tax=Durotheca rogersii TaxID=419775 RepID=UPI002220D60D|nr:uncharacterized protein GGS23DRAFT_262546 [Durotheca rogersii]KAI5859820.1 hypothetical protein GGS23DRAFT_262546 [Durotheca rogersii]
MLGLAAETVVVNALQEGEGKRCRILARFWLISRLRRQARRVVGFTRPSYACCYVVSRRSVGQREGRERTMERVCEKFAFSGQGGLPGCCELHICSCVQAGGYRTRPARRDGSLSWRGNRTESLAWCASEQTTQRVLCIVEFPWYAPQPEVRQSDKHGLAMGGAGGTRPRQSNLIPNPSELEGVTNRTSRDAQDHTVSTESLALVLVEVPSG